MVEHFHGMEGVWGSIPHSSTNNPRPLVWGCGAPGASTGKRGVRSFVYPLGLSGRETGERSQDCPTLRGNSHAHGVKDSDRKLDAC